MEAISKQGMLSTLPIRSGEFTIRRWERQDVDARLEWPSYPFPYEAFSATHGDTSDQERDLLFRVRDEDDSRISLTVECQTKAVIGLIVLLDIDWKSGIVGNMGVRLSPEWCDKGIGTIVLRLVTAWCFECGLKQLQLDVAAPNGRAARCYEKVGFVRIKECWQDDETLRKVNLDDPKQGFLLPHVRVKNDTPQVRFYWMAIRRD